MANVRNRIKALECLKSVQADTLRSYTEDQYKTSLELMRFVIEEEMKKEKKLK